MITEQQFNDFASKMFLQFDEVNRKIDYNYRQLRSAIDHVGTELAEFKAEMTEFKAEMMEFKAEMSEFKVEMKAFSAKTDERLTALE